MILENTVGGEGWEQHAQKIYLYRNIFNISLKSAFLYILPENKHAKSE